MGPNVTANLAEDAIQTLVSQTRVVKNKNLHNTTVTGNNIISNELTTLKRHPVPLNTVNGRQIQRS